jgi:hypothetical protein
MPGNGSGYTCCATSAARTVEGTVVGYQSSASYPTVETAAPPSRTSADDWIAHPCVSVIPDAPAACAGPAISSAPATKIKNGVLRLSMADSPSANFADHGMGGAPSMNPLRDAVHASEKR